MTSTTVTTPSATRTAPAANRPGVGRRVALYATTVVAGLAPTVWGAASLAQLATGTETDHRFHQLTGQGLLLAAVWLGPVLAVSRAGLRGRRPSAAAGFAHLAVVVAALVAGAVAQEGGGLFAAVLAAVPGALLWAALPARPQLRLGSLDVVLAPLALLSAALVAPFFLDQLALQSAMGDEHAELAHYFDMAWVTGTLVLLSAAAALSAPARRLAVAAGAGFVLVGGSSLALTDDATWSLLALLLGAVTAAAGARRSAA